MKKNPYMWKFSHQDHGYVYMHLYEDLIAYKKVKTKN